MASPPIQESGPVMAQDVPVARPPGDLSDWVGVWEDEDTQGHVRVTVRLEGLRPTVIDITESEGDREHFELRSTRWEGGALTFTDWVPSTDYLVTYRCTDVEADRMHCTWSNDHGAKGEGALKRVLDR